MARDRERGKMPSVSCYKADRQPASYNCFLYCCTDYSKALDQDFQSQAKKKNHSSIKSFEGFSLIILKCYLVREHSQY